MDKIGNEWDEVLAEVLADERFLAIENMLKKAREIDVVYPPKEKMFRAFQLAAPKDIAVVILGQDPYHGAGQADGLCFSVGNDVKIPPSLRNIFLSLTNDYPDTNKQNGDLSGWAKQGVLLLNTVLSVAEGQANSHSNIGWQWFSDEVIKILNNSTQAIVFLLWGANAKSKQKLITDPKHLVLSAAHPSPLSVYRGFLQCGHFSAANKFLEKEKRNPIMW